MSKLFVDLFDTGLKELKSLDNSVASRIELRRINTVNQVHSIGLQDTELSKPIKPRMIEKVQKIQPHTQIDFEYSDIEPVYAEDFELPKGSFDEFKTRFDTHIKKLKSIEFKIPTQLKEIYLDLVEKLNNILNYIEDVAVGLFAEFVEYIGRFIQWLSGPTQRTAEDILIEIKDVNETVELVENVIKK